MFFDSSRDPTSALELPMRPHILVAAVILAACAKPEQKQVDTQAAATPAPAAASAPAPAAITAATLAGKWSGTTQPMNKDTTLTTVDMSLTSTNDGWTLTLPNGTHPVRVVTIGGDSVVTESGPFPSAVFKGKQLKLNRTVLHLRDGKLTGTTHATYAGGDTATFRMELTRKAP